MIKLIKSTFYNEEKTKEALIEFIKSARQLSFGPECEKFEENFAKYQGRKYCVFFNSGSSANLALIQSLLNLGKIKKGDNVGFSALTWSTNVMPFLQLGLNPIPVDIELNTLNISSRKFEDFIKRYSVKLLFLTNLLGFCDDIDRIKNICEEKNIIFIEDNCESLGTVYKGKKLGNFGLASSFSFYVGHNMSTIEGGAVCTNDEEMATMLKIVRAHGWDRQLNEQERGKLIKDYNVEADFWSKYTFYDLGYNLRPTEINGFLGNIQLLYINEINQKRFENFKEFASKIYGNNRYFPVKFEHIDFVSNFAVPVICKSKEIKDEIINKCADKIEIRPIVGGDMTNQPFFKKYVINNNFSCPNAKLVHYQGLYFGNNPELTAEEINKIIHVFTQ